MSARPLLLVVSPGDEIYRGYCLEQVAASYDVVLLTGTEPSWEKPHIVDHAVADLDSTTDLLAAGRLLAERHELAGVVTWSEWHLVPTARLARALELPTNSVEVMRACRNKATARTLFARHGVPSAASMTARSLVEAGLATMTIGYPAVLKPAAFAGSIGVIRIDRPEQLPDAFTFASAGAGQSREDTAVLVEEYLDGRRSRSSASPTAARPPPSPSPARASARRRTSRRPATPSTPTTRSSPRSRRSPPPRSRPWASPTASSTSRCAWSTTAPASSRSTPASAAT